MMKARALREKVESEEKKRLKIRIRGIVQGVGFRPFVYSLAKRYLLNGFVLNDTEGVVIEVEGIPSALTSFVEEVKRGAPPLSQIEQISTEEDNSIGYEDFVIRPSASRKGTFILISPDIATCEDCLNELLSPQDRRFEYPFINCTNCGPRFTIMKDIPYDRERTTMKEFSMCNLCEEEYHNPLNRRFHAQPDCCSQCGPEVSLVRSQDLNVEAVGKAGVERTVRLLREGKIVAMKGLGGFHLACDASNEEAVSRLRGRKYREDKPFAVMAQHLEDADSFCYVDRCSRELLLSKRRPVVLMEKRKPELLAKSVAPKQASYGVMLAYTPLHHLILQKSGLILVMTSGNLSDEPICYTNSEASQRLRAIADYFLFHNRDIHMRCDDSVTRCFDGDEMIIRRSRGYVPEPIELPFRFKRHVLACGAELKNTFCVARDNYAFLSHHIGDLENVETLTAFEQGVEHFKRLFFIEPEVVAYDMHPEYLSTKYAEQLKCSDTRELQVIPVQHHHAHVVSCMAENGIQEKVIGVAFDGLGYGEDEKLWGGEFLVADFAHYRRVAHLTYIPMPSGTQAIREPWRMALSYLYHVYGDRLLGLDIEFVRHVDKKKWNILKAMICSRFNAPLTSGAGRLFDAVSALLGVCQISNYEGQAAVELEMVAKEHDRSASTIEPYGYETRMEGETLIIEPEQIIAGIVEDLQKSVPIPIISRKFHAALSKIIVDTSVCIRRRTGLNTVVLSGGVFQNMLLLYGALHLLRNEGFRVFTHHKVPTNDGGVCLGQAVIAEFSVRK